MEILSFGVGARIEICAAALRGMSLSSDGAVERLIILPIPTTRERRPNFWHF